MQATLLEVQTHLPEYIDRAKSGEELTIIENGIPVARLVPLTKTPAELEREAVARLDALPWIRPGNGGKLTGTDRPISWKPGEKTLSDLVLEDRE
ncbi:type II toxin-antitoxin system Phd/YefM family antitoxin [Methylomagnum sp.]